MNIPYICITITTRRQAKKFVRWALDHDLDALLDDRGDEVWVHVPDAPGVVTEAEGRGFGVVMRDRRP